MHSAGKYKSCSFVAYPEHNLKFGNLVTFIRTLVKKVEPVLGAAATTIIGLSFPES